MTRTRTQIAEALRAAGMPDVLNRFLTMTDEQFAQRNHRLDPPETVWSAPVKPDTESLIRAEADLRWRQWVPGKNAKGETKLSRPRLSTFVKQVRRERRQQEKAMKQAAKSKTIAQPKPGSKEAQVKALREQRAKTAAQSRASDVKSPEPSAPAQPKEIVMKSAKKKSKPKTKPKKTGGARKGKSANTSITRAKRADAAAATGGVRAGTKLAIVVALLKRPEGCTTKDVLASTNWPSVSMPQMAKAAGLTLSKEKRDGVTVYRAA